MKKLLSLTLSLVLLFVVASASGTSGSVFAEPSDITATPTEKVTEKPTEKPEITEEATPTCTPTVEVAPTETIIPTAEATPTPTTVSESTPTPTEKPGIGGAAPTPTPEVAVLGAQEMAKAGAFEETVMNMFGIFGMLLLAAGSFIYAKKQRNIQNAF